MLKHEQLSEIFVFAHQDDESAVYQKIVDALQMGHRVVCVFVTSGVTKGLDSSKRNIESTLVLTSLGVTPNHIYFAGDIVGITDGDLVNKLDQAAQWLEEVFLNNGPLNRIYLPAWEGGHPDHDALHAICVSIGKQHSFLGAMRQYSLYNGYHCKGPLFRTFLPLQENGPIEKEKISWPNRVRFLKNCLQYPSQVKTWIGLFPMMLIHYIFWGTQNLQCVSFRRIMTRPHRGKLYYERRKFAAYENVHQKISAFVSNNNESN
jgi:LmbE family N-acetylglucosaminyl deacetylase